MSKVPICNIKGDSLGEFTLADELLEIKKGAQAVHDAVTAQRAKARAGTASTLKRGEVAGGGSKPWKQKGTGRARAGTSRSPIWRGGGIAFGPKPRSYAKHVNKKVARAAFRRAFSEKVAEGQVMVIDKLDVAEPKTKVMVEVLKKLKVEKGVLLVLESIEKNVALASRNLPDVEVVSASSVNTYQLLRYSRILISQDAMGKIEERLKKCGGRASS